MKLSTIKMLSTVAEIRWEDAGGKVLARISRNKRGQCALRGEVPADRPHYQVVVYADPLRAEDKTFIPAKPAAHARRDIRQAS